MMDLPTPYETVALVIAGIHPAAPQDKILEVCTLLGDSDEEEYKQVLDMLQDALEGAGVSRGNWANVIQNRTTYGR